MIPLEYHYMWEDSGHDIEKFVELVEDYHESEMRELENRLTCVDDESDYTEAYEHGYEEGIQYARRAMNRALDDV